MDPSCFPIMDTLASDRCGRPALEYPRGSRGPQDTASRNLSQCKSHSIDAMQTT